MKLIRYLLGNTFLFLNRLFSPRSIQRPDEYQAKVDSQTQKMALYEFEACPFCIKVRRAIKQMNLKIEIRDIKKSIQFEEELMKGRDLSGSLSSDRKS